MKQHSPACEAKTLLPEPRTSTHPEKGTGGWVEIPLGGFCLPCFRGSVDPLHPRVPFDLRFGGEH